MLLLVLLEQEALTGAMLVARCTVRMCSSVMFRVKVYTWFLLFFAFSLFHLRMRVTRDTGHVLVPHYTVFLDTYEAISYISHHHGVE
jgi:hypothetical protein